MASQFAAPELYLDSELSELQRALLRYAEVTGQRLGTVVKQNTRLIAWNLAHNTQPYGMDLAARRKGDTSIAIDLFGGKKGGVGTGNGRAGIFFSVNATILKKFEDGWGGKVRIQAHSGPDQRLFVKKNGEVWGTEKTLYRPNASTAELDAHHRRYFKNGRMTQSGSRDRIIGRWRFIDRMVVDQKNLKDYLKTVQKKVGFGKAGWITAGSKLGSIRNVPAWITRHKGTAPGVCDDQTSRKDDPFATLTNAVLYASSIIPDREVAAALKIQREKMLAHIEHVLVNTARESGFDARPDRTSTALPAAA